MAMLFSGYLTDKIGRKLSMVACSVIYTIGWLLIVLVVEFTDSPVFRILLFTGRFIVGISIGWTSLCVNVSVKFHYACDTYTCYRFIKSSANYCMLGVVCLLPAHIRPLLF